MAATGAKLIELGVLQHPDVLPHARKGHVECLGQIRDRRVASSEPLQDATPGGIGQRREGGIKSVTGILNHMVHFTPVDRRMQALFEPAVDRGRNRSVPLGDLQSRLHKRATAELAWERLPDDVKMMFDPARAAASHIGAAHGG